MNVKFIPSFFMTQRYAGQGTIEIMDDSLRVSGRRIWSLGKRLAVVIPIFALLLFANVILGLAGILLLWTLVCRSQVNDTIPLSRISDIRKLRGRRAQFRIAARNAEVEAKVVFAGKEVDLLLQELQTRMARVGAEEGAVPAIVNYDIFRHRHNFSVWAAARATQRSFTRVDKLRDALQNSGLVEFIRDHASSEIDASTFAEHHGQWCENIIEVLKDSRVANVTFGRAAKLVAVYIKSMVVVGPYTQTSLARVAHPPIDRILLQNLSRLENLSREAKYMNS